MFRHLVRIGVVAGGLVAALAFSGSALAAPTTPQVVSPSGPAVFGSPVTVSWTASTFDAGAFPKWYRLTVIDLTTSTGVYYDLFGTSKTIAVSAGHKYAVCVRANQVLNGQQQSSPSSCRVFTAYQKPIIKEYYYEEIKFPPDPPWCLTCPIWDLFLDEPDPRVVETIRSSRGYEAASVVGLAVDPRGAARLIFSR